MIADKPCEVIGQSDGRMDLRKLENGCLATSMLGSHLVVACHPGCRFYGVNKQRIPSGTERAAETWHNPVCPNDITDTLRGWGFSGGVLFRNRGSFIRCCHMLASGDVSWINGHGGQR